MNSLDPEFDADFYRKSYPDLQHMDRTTAEDHWHQFGIREGRLGSRLAIRENFIPFLSEETSILEIGPFGKPVVTGPHVSYFDVLSQDDLKARAERIGLDPDRVPAIDWVSPVGDLSIVDRRFTAVVSSHCVEHQPDLIRHLKAVANVLKAGGRYYLVVPDKRFCFDALIPESSVADIIEARGATVHKLLSVIEHRAFTTHNDTSRHWAGDHLDDTHWESVLPRTNAALKEFEAAAGGYVDVHAWQFTPDSFRAVMAALHRKGLIDLVVERVYQTAFHKNEFTAVLCKPGE
ncbi:class I SAM-dependent methyltransferase [Lichenifustis flavocetrariae]|uniref:Class I SAM-dependent methyltransferase n=1 Tax=Lichenifustis flavocetrariae TaxID=2949735 RepID=A0AA42CQH6_9HYPH|nr:methyltransferase domain-containing protein [Lichenifustis flavocetrariae]MCW6511462.1 class I SAM-dependent methyltransferase [Lichenifustis flavocetrariae]